MDNGEITFATVKEIIGKTGKASPDISQYEVGWSSELSFMASLSISFKRDELILCI